MAVNSFLKEKMDHVDVATQVKSEKPFKRFLKLPFVNKKCEDFA